MTINIRPTPLHSPVTSLDELDKILADEMKRLLSEPTFDHATIAIRHGTLDWVRSLLDLEGLASKSHDITIVVEDRLEAAWKEAGYHSSLEAWQAEGR